MILYGHLDSMIDIDQSLKEIFSDPSRRRAWVIYRLNLMGKSMAYYAKQAGVTRGCLYAAFKKPYPRMEQVIADAVGLTPQILFPERYNADGLPVQRRGRPYKYNHDDTEAKNKRNVKKAEAV
jgi:Ner family transcriptional regulator